MTRQRFSGHVVTIVLVCGACSVFLSAHVWASDIQTVYFPVAAMLDLDAGNEQPVLCDMWFKCRAIRYNIPLASFRQVSRLPAERLLSEILGLVTREDIEAAKEVSYWGQEEFSGNTRLRMQMTMQILKPLVQEDIGGLEILYQVFSGDERIFYLRREHPEFGQVIIPILMVELDSGVFWNFSGEEEETARYLRAMIRDSLEQCFRQTVTLTSAVDRAFDHSLLLTNKDSEYPVYLMFNGKACVGREYLDMRDSADQAVSLLWTRHSLVKTGNKDKIGSLYTQKSREIYDGIMERNVLAEYDWFIRIWARPPQAEYIIDANPLYVPVRKTASGFAFEYVLRSKENDSERFQLTNFRGQDFFIQLLKSEQFASEFTQSLASQEKP